MKVRRATRKLAELLVSDPRAIGELFEAQWAVVRARTARRHQPLGQLVEQEPADALKVPPGTGWRDVVMRINDAMDRVARFGFLRPTCLEYALALQWVLRRRKIGPGVIRVGVQVRDGAFAAHAWLQLGDMVLGDSQSRVARFQHLTDVKAFRL